MPDEETAEVARKILNGCYVGDREHKLAPELLVDAIALALVEASARGARVERERCIADAEGERLTGDTGEEEDKAYNMAIEHVVDAIRSRALSVGSAAGE